MDDSQALAGHVLDVLCPGTALDVDQDVGGGVGEHHGNEGVHVACTDNFIRVRYS